MSKNHQISVMLNHSVKNKVQGGRDEFARYNASFKRHTLTVRDWLIEIYNGYGFCPVFSNNRRIKSNFIEAWYVALDFDTCDSHSTLETLEHSPLSRHAAFAYTSPSHTAENPKARLVFVFDKPITDGVRYEQLITALLDAYPHADRSARDCVRLFYGAEKCGTWVNWAVMDSSTIQYILAGYQAKQEAVRAEQLAAVPANSITVNDDNDDKFLNSIVAKRIETALSKLSVAGKGERHNVRRNVGRELGGYVGAGYVTRADVESQAVKIARAVSDTPDKAEREIIKAIEHGMTQPLTIDVERYRTVRYRSVQQIRRGRGLDTKPSPDQQSDRPQRGDILRTNDGRNITIHDISGDFVAGLDSGVTDPFYAKPYRLINGVAHRADPVSGSVSGSVSIKL